MVSLSNLYGFILACYHGKLLEVFRCSYHVLFYGIIVEQSVPEVRVSGMVFSNNGVYSVFVGFVT